MKNRILFVFIVLFFAILISGCNSDEKKIEYAKNNESAKLFLQYYPEAQTEFNAERTRIRFIVSRNNRELYIQVPAKEKIEADETLYCAKISNNRTEMLFSEENKDLMEIKLKNNSCFE